MKKTFFALALGLVMSATAFAQNRQVSTPLPADVPSVTLTISGKQQVVKPTKVQMKEIDEKHIECSVFAGKDKATVKLPISYNTGVDAIYKCADFAYVCGLITREQQQQIIDWAEKTLGADL